MTEDKFFLSPDAGYSTVVKCYDMLGDAIGYEIPRMMLYNIATDDSEKVVRMPVTGLVLLI